jgi:hypothetical protein
MLIALKTEFSLVSLVRRRREYDRLLFPDLSRIGVRTLRNLGVAESVAMTLSDRKTPSVCES